MTNYQHLRPSEWFLALGTDLSALSVCLAGVHFALGLAWWLMWPSLLVLVILIGSFQHALAVLAHEGAHRNIHPDTRINDQLGQFAFLFIGGNLLRYREFHSTHHAFPGVSGLDPELEHINHPAYAAHWPRPFSWRKFWWQAFKIMFLWEGLRNMIFVVRLTCARTLREAVPNIIFFVGAIAVSLALGLWWIPIVWTVALITSFWFFLWFEIFTEHMGSDETFLFDAPTWMRWITHPHNIWMHRAHHENASVPFYNLRLRTHAATQEPIGARELFRRLQRETGRDSLNLAN